MSGEGRSLWRVGAGRTLCDGGVFSKGVWWDKSADADNHTDVFPIGQNVLNVSTQLKQNPGY